MIRAERTGPIPLIDISSSLLAVFGLSKAWGDMFFFNLKGDIIRNSIVVFKKEGLS